MKTHTEQPNFTIVLPGGCGAKCHFCTDRMNYKAPEDWFQRLTKVLLELPSKFEVVTVTGGEPTNSRYLIPVLHLINSMRDWKRVVLTTYGAKLDDFNLEGLVTHVNISRHAIGFTGNKDVFKVKDLPSDMSIACMASKLQRRGIQVNINYVYDDQLTEGSKRLSHISYVADFVEYAKRLYANSVTFRYDQNKGLTEETPLESAFSGYHRIYEGSCGVCRNFTVLVNGMPVTFKSSEAEPSNKTDDIFELIFGVKGVLSSDWEGKKPVSFISSQRNHFTVDELFDRLHKHAQSERNAVLRYPDQSGKMNEAPVRTTLGQPSLHFISGGGCGKPSGGGCG